MANVKTYKGTEFADLNSGTTARGTTLKVARPLKDGSLLFAA